MAKMMWRANGVRGMGPPKVRLWLGRMDRHDRELWAIEGEAAGVWGPSQIDQIRELMKVKRP